MLSGQSNIRNKILAPIFKRLGIIEQWGNGLKLIADELKKYPEIGFDWKEPGMSFRVIFFGFLDIEMPGEDGFELLKSLKNINFNIIFITAYNQYAIKAFKFSAIDYLLKPLKIPELISSVNRVKTVMSQRQFPDYKALLENIQSAKPLKIVLSTTESREYLNIDDIIQIEGDVNYSKFFLIGGRTIMVSKTLKVYEDLLIGNDFFRTHKSNLVNLKHVKRIISKDGLSIEMADGSHAMLSRQCKDDFLLAMDSFVK